jgi:hypothetical protein
MIAAFSSNRSQAQGRQMKPTETTPEDVAFERELRLKKLDHEHDEYVKRLDQEWALPRDALQFTKDYGLFTLRSCLVLNGGAMLAFVGNLYGHATAGSIKLHDFGYAIGLFTLGLIATVVASICGYFNFLTSQRRLTDSFTFLKMRSVIGTATPDYAGNWTRTSATVLVIASLMSFVGGVAYVVRILWSY